jgi:hypothetical protein
MVIRTLVRNRLLLVARTGAAMKQTKTRNRVVVIGSPAPTTEKIARREPGDQQVTSRRMVVIKNGELVGSRPRR